MARTRYRARVHVFFWVVGQRERNLSPCFPARCFLIAIAATTAGASANMVSVGASCLCEYVVKGRKKAGIAKHGFVLLVRANVCVCVRVRVGGAWLSIAARMCSRVRVVCVSMWLVRAAPICVRVCVVRRSFM